MPLLPASKPSNAARQGRVLVVVMGQPREVDLAARTASAHRAHASMAHEAEIGLHAALQTVHLQRTMKPDWAFQRAHSVLGVGKHTFRGE